MIAVDPKVLEDCKQQLYELRERLTTEVHSGELSILEAAQTTGEGSHLPTHAADHDSGAVESNVATTQQQAQMLQAVDAVLARVAAGNYGLCESCDGRIAPYGWRRFLTLPTASTAPPNPRASNGAGVAPRALAAGWIFQQMLELGRRRGFAAIT